VPAPPRHLIRLADLSDEALGDVLDLSLRLKRRPARTPLSASTVGMLFFRGSLRTRTSLEAAVQQLGGHTINLTATSDFWDLEDREGSVMDGRAPEHVKDAAAVLSRYVDALAIRPDPQGQTWALDRRDAQIMAWSRHATVPVFNMESALWHPLQALADLFTLRETLGEVRGRRLALVWVHSPEPASPAVAHSLLHAALRSGMEVSVAHPPGFSLDEGVLEEARALADQNRTTVRLGLGLEEALEGAEIVYARSWQSIGDYGNLTLEASRRGRLTDWKIGEAAMERTAGARLMHAMPVRRNVEVTDAILDGPCSLVHQQAENRLHTQKALLQLLLSQRA